jgi:hypothetical protein
MIRIFNPRLVVYVDKNKEYFKIDGYLSKELFEYSDNTEIVVLEREENKCRLHIKTNSRKVTPVRRDYSENFNIHSPLIFSIDELKQVASILKIPSNENLGKKEFVEDYKRLIIS